MSLKLAEWRATIRERVLSSLEHGIPEKLGSLEDAALGLDWQPEAFEAELDSMLRNEARALEIITVLDGWNGRVEPLDKLIDGVCAELACKVDRAILLERAALPSDDEVPDCFAPVLLEILESIADRCGEAARIRILAMEDSDRSLHLLADPISQDLREALLARLSGLCCREAEARGNDDELSLHVVVPRSTR